VVPHEQWRPWGVANVVLGDQHIECAGCRARTCPFAGQPCTAGVTAEEIARAVRSLAARVPEVAFADAAPRHGTEEAAPCVR
jgi:hypothetical protein